MVDLILSFARRIIKNLTKVDQQQMLGWPHPDDHKCDATLVELGLGYDVALISPSIEYHIL